MYLFWRQYLHLNVVEKMENPSGKIWKWRGESPSRHLESSSFRRDGSKRQREVIFNVYLLLFTQRIRFASQHGFFSSSFRGDEGRRGLSNYWFAYLPHISIIRLFFPTRDFPRGVHSNHAQQFVEKNARLMVFSNSSLFHNYVPSAARTRETTNLTPPI